MIHSSKNLLLIDIPGVKAGYQRWKLSSGDQVPSLISSGFAKKDAPPDGNPQARWFKRTRTTRIEPTGLLPNARIAAWVLANCRHGRVFQIQAMPRFADHNPDAGRQCIAVIGHPIWRAIDTFRNIRNSSDHRLHATAKRNGFCMEGFFNAPEAKPLINRQTKFLANVSTRGIDDPIDLKQMAMDFLHNRCVWVTTEDALADHETQLNRQLQAEGYSLHIARCANVNPPKEIEAIPPRILDFLERIHATDMELYRYAHNHPEPIE